MIILRDAVRERLERFGVADVFITDVPFDVSRNPPSNAAFGGKEPERIRADKIRQNRNSRALSEVAVVIVACVKRQASDGLCRNVEERVMVAHIELAQAPNQRAGIDDNIGFAG